MHLYLNLKQLIFCCFVANFFYLNQIITMLSFPYIYLYHYPFFRAAFKIVRRVHFALRRKMLKPPIARLPAIYLDLKIAQVKRRNAFMKQLSRDLRRGSTDFISCQFKAQMKKMAAQIDFCLLCNAFLSFLQYGA